MKKVTVSFIVLAFLLASLLFISGCKESAAATPLGGMITISLTGANVANGDTLYVGVFDLGADPFVDPTYGGIEETISSGEAAAVVTYLGGLQITFPAGSYDVYGFIDVNDDSGGDPDPTDDYIFSGPISITVDGNQTVPVVIGDFDPPT